MADMAGTLALERSTVTALVDRATEPAELHRADFVNQSCRLPA
jgi:hypothetical protein